MSGVLYNYYGDVWKNGFNSIVWFDNSIGLFIVRIRDWFGIKMGMVQETIGQ